MSDPVFKKERTLYWPAEFGDVMAMLTGVREGGELGGPRLFQTNAHVMVLAAIIGVNNNRMRSIGNSQKKEISTQTFALQNLDRYLLLVPLMGNSPLGQDLLRAEHEDAALKMFEDYAGGGLEILARLFNESAGKSPEIVLQSELLSIIDTFDKDSSESDAVPDIFA